MTMVIDNSGRHYGGMGYENMYANNVHSSPHYSNPWGAHGSSSSATSTYPPLAKQDNSRPNTIPLSYPQMPVSAPPPLASGSSYSSAGYGGSDLLSLPQDIPRSTYGTEQSYTTSSPGSSSFNPSYPSLGYAQSIAQQQHQQHHLRKLSEHSDNSRTTQPSFGELDASRGMLALSHQNLTELTPRNLYEAKNARGSTDGYGFPSAHSPSSSISAASGRADYPYSYGSSIASDSATDYSSTASDAGYDSMTASRTLPRPSQLVGANLGPPAPQSMMGQFSSKMSTNTQKKHKCKVCDKRFTRPSSLQTHMYSHTGEKPFACNVDGCGRHFSVVSNLRRHRKVHKGESTSCHSDED